MFYGQVLVASKFSLGYKATSQTLKEWLSLWDLDLGIHTHTWKNMCISVSNTHVVKSARENMQLSLINHSYLVTSVYWHNS